MGFDVTKGASYAVLYSTLAFFTFLAVGSAGYLKWLPEKIRGWMQLSRVEDSADYFLAARNSASAFVLALSYFAGGMGAWVLYGTTEMGANPQLSWLGVMGYSIASAFPAILICWLGPMIRRMNPHHAFSTTDFGRKRYGRIMQLVIATISVFYMFIYIVAEMTAISGIFALLTNDYVKRFSIGITIAMGAITILYTSIAGLPASIVTDKFQGMIMAILVIILLIAVTTQNENHVSRAEFDLASNWTGQGAKAAVTLIIAISCAELFNQSNWQRVWAAESEQAMRRGFFFGSILVFFLMMFFGVMGMLAYANDPTSYNNGEKYAYLSFFDLIEPLKNGWHVMVLLLTTALSASSIDSLQNGLTCIFAHDVVKIGYNPKWIARALLLAANAPAVWLASKQYDVISLFLVADLVCSTCVLPVYLGLQTKDFGILKAPTEFGAFLGCLSGVAAVLINGVVNNAQGGLFEYFWLRNDGICSLCGTKTMVSFIITPLVAGFMTYFFSYFDILLRGKRAREPIIPVPFDKDDKWEESEDSEDFIEDDEEQAPGIEEGLATNEADGVGLSNNATRGEVAT